MLRRLAACADEVPAFGIGINCVVIGNKNCAWQKGQSECGLLFFDPNYSGQGVGRRTRNG